MEFERIKNEASLSDSFNARSNYWNAVDNLLKNGKFCASEVHKHFPELKVAKSTLNSIKQKRRRMHPFATSKLIIIPKKYILATNEKSWLSGNHIDLALESMQKQYNHVKIITCHDQKNLKNINFENTKNLIMILFYKSHWVTVTNIDTCRSHIATQNDNIPVFLYDSFNDKMYIESLKKTLKGMFPNLKKYIVYKAQMLTKQEGCNDCGLFSLAYVESLCKNIEPSLVKFDQKTMRQEYNKFLDRNLINYNTNIIDYQNDSTIKMATTLMYSLDLLN